MLYIHHILFSLLAGVGISIIAYALGVKNLKLLTIFIVGAVATQHLDVDHYASSFESLVACGLKGDVDSYKADDRCLDLHRGFMHQFRTGLFFGGLFIGWAVHFFSWMKSNLKKTLFIWVGANLIMVSLTQQFFVEASLFTLAGLLLTGVIFKTKKLWVGVVLLSICTGWIHHMYLDDLLHFWFGQVT